MKEIKTEALYHPRTTGKQDVSLQAAAWSFPYGTHKQVIFYTFMNSYTIILSWQVPKINCTKTVTLLKKRDFFFFLLTRHCVLFQAQFSVYNLALVVAE